LGIQITARHDSVSDGMKRYAEEKGQKLSRFFDGLGKIEIVLDADGPNQRAEAVITIAHGETIAVSAVAEKMNAAIDGMIDRAQRKIRRHKSKIRDHRAGVPEPEPPAEPDEESSLESYQDVVDKTDFPPS